jgi:hypothetical protein
MDPVRNSNFAYLLEAFRVNLAEWKVTGNDANRIAYENAQRGLQSILISQQNSVAANQAHIRTFMEDYQTTNSDLVQLHEKSIEIRKEGPKIQDEYETTKRLNPAPAVNNTGLYVKAGIVAGLTALIAFVATR